MKVIPVCAIVAVLFLRESLEQCLTKDDQESTSTIGRNVLYNGQQEFSLALLHAINQLMPNENLFFSPYSTYHALLIAYFMAGNQTERYLKKVLRIEPTLSKTNVHLAYKLDKISTSWGAKNGSYEFTNANKIYVADQIQVRSCIEGQFHDELEKLPFRGDPEKARNTINGWVEHQTRNNIKDLLPSGTIDASTTLVLVNAAYFKGIWKNKFDPQLTNKEIFYVSPSKQIMVDMMHIEGTFNHDVSESLGAHILELPYEGDEISMFIFLPPFTKPDAIDTTLKNLTFDKFKEIVENNSLISRTVKVSLPKFTLEQTIELVPVLQRLGIGDLFENTSDFSTLTESTVSLGRGLHKARIEVTEEGTKAAATTVLFSFRSSRPAEPAHFNCNHPFVYVIYDKTNKAVLFTGVFRRPY